MKLTKLISSIISESLDENYMKSDAIGYNIGKYLYHVTTKRKLNIIKKNGFVPMDGVAINGKPFKNRLYFATSLIAAYDLSVNFSAYRDDTDYVIFKLTSNCVDNGYEKDPLFVHGIYVKYPISNKCIVEVIDANDLFRRFDDNDLENLYF